MRRAAWAAGAKIYFELSDHLGNTRAIVTETSGSAEVVSFTDYYPHGGVMPGQNYASSLAYRYGYQGQEKDPETGLVNFELRQYDARLGRWYNPDPMGQHHSPYLAMGNNPVSSVDPNGGWDTGPTDGSQIGSGRPSWGDVHNGEAASMALMDAGNDLQAFRNWSALSPAERRHQQDLNRTSYEVTFKDRVIENVNEFKYYGTQGKLYYYDDNKGDYGHWEAFDDIEGKAGQRRTGRLVEGAVEYDMTGSPVTGSLWVGLQQGWKQGQYQRDGWMKGLQFIEKFNPVSNLWDAGAHVLNGTDKYGHRTTGWQAATSGVAGVLGIWGGEIAGGLTGLFVGEGTPAVSIVETEAINNLNPTHFLTRSKSQMQNLINDIKNNGILDPIEYVEHAGEKYIVGGNHRFFAAQKLGIERVPVKQVQLPHAGYNNSLDLMLEGNMPGYWKYLKN